MRQYQILAEAMPHAVFTADANGAISYGNRAWHDTIGSNDAASPDWNWLASLHPEDAPRGRAAWMHAVDACEPFEKQLRFRRATDGMYRWFVCRATPVCDPFGKVERWIGSTADIHDYKVASETRGVLDALGHLVSIRNADGRFDYVSPNLALVTGIAADADWYDALHPDDRACVFGERREAGEAERAIRQDEIRLRTSDDDYRWFLSRTVHLAGETAPRQICTLTDIDDLKRTQAAFAESEASYRALIESMPQMVWIEDRDIRVRYVNGRWLEYTGLPFTPGMPSSTIAISHPDDLAAVEAAHEARCAGSEIDCEVRLRRHDGVYRWHLIRTVPLGDGTQSATWVVTGTDIEERKAAETALARSAEDLAHRAHHDPLTGLLNRSHLAERLAALIDAARTDGSELAVMYLDLDHFKAINDSLGHNAGDELLVEVARRISLALRNDDLASRFGGDEFVMVCRAGSDDVVNVAERVQARVAAPLGVCGRRVVTAASIGISLFPRDGSTAAELIHRADVAMYAAKEAGRNGWARYNANAHLESEESIDLEVELREAISQRQFVVFYQPIVNLADGRPVGAEALVRWLHPTRGLLGPGEFIAFAEQHGLIAPIGEIVLETVCAEVAQRTSAPTRSLRFAVNVSARQFAKPGFVEFLEGTIARAGIDARDLEIEITESVVMGNSASVAGTLDAVRALGVSIAIDDFGTGYGSLAYIKSFAVDTLKIDRSFVAGIGHDPTDRAIATTIVALARSLGMRTVAEGIETVEQLDHMREIGADLAQGYLICRPVPAAEFLAFLEATART
jgi:diguanylate cyclase (GGDEF)-like protein/PAS domain S-box-containing protein